MLFDESNCHRVRTAASQTLSSPTTERMKTCAARSATWTRCTFLYDSSRMTQDENRRRRSRAFGTSQANSFRRRWHSSRSIILRTTTDVDAPVEQENTEETFNWFKHWWPVQYTYNLDDDRPNRIELLGEFFAVWKSKSGEWIAMKDMCPHRLAPLSEGAALQTSLSA